MHLSSLWFQLLRRTLPVGLFSKSSRLQQRGKYPALGESRRITVFTPFFGGKIQIKKQQ